VVDLWPAESLTAARTAIVQECLLLSDDLVVDRYQRHLTWLFELALRQPAVPWTSALLVAFVPFLHHCSEKASVAVFPVIGEFLLTIAKDPNFVQGAIVPWPDLVPIFVGRIYQSGDFMPFILVLLLLFKLFPFPDDRLADDLYGILLKVAVVWLSSAATEADLFSACELIGPLWSRRLIPLRAGRGSIITQVCALTGEGVSFRVRHGAAVIVLERMRDSLPEMIEVMSPHDVISLCFQLFVRMPFEATGDEKLLAIRSFRTASGWYAMTGVLPPLTEILDAGQLERSFVEWNANDDEAITEDLQELIERYAELFPGMDERVASVRA
jgi:hypothetical protein